MLQSKEKATFTLLQIHKKQENIPFSISIQIFCMHNQFRFFVIVLISVQKTTFLHNVMKVWHL